MTNPLHKHELVAVIGATVSTFLEHLTPILQLVIGLLTIIFMVYRIKNEQKKLKE